MKAIESRVGPDIPADQRGNRAYAQQIIKSRCDKPRSPYPDLQPRRFYRPLIP